MTTNSNIPAAQYLRMSTERQQYSLENQSAAIQKYAEGPSFRPHHRGYRIAIRSVRIVLVAVVAVAIRVCAVSHLGTSRNDP